MNPTNAGRLTSTCLVPLKRAKSMRNPPLLYSPSPSPLGRVTRILFPPVGSVPLLPVGGVLGGGRGRGGVMVAGFPRCEADFIVERNTRCTYRAILRFSLSHSLFLSFLCNSLSESGGRVLMKKGRSCGRYKIDKTGLHCHR